VADDLDLDELHEAVSAMMDESKSKRGKPSSDMPAPMATPKTDVPSLAEPVAVNKPEPASAPSASEKIEVKRPLPNLSIGRPRGRAMDVFTPKPAMPSVPAKVKRQAATLQPTQQVIVEPPKAVVAEMPKPAQTPEPPALPEVAIPDQNLADQSQATALPSPKMVENEWPDPLDGFINKTNAEPAPEAPSLTQAPDENAEQNAPMVSPFLNTKVEKRPLGAYSSDVPPALPEGSQIPAADLPANNPEVEPRPEFDQPTVIEQPPQPEEFTMEPDFQEARQATIPQQYQTDPKETNTDSRPVFDTKDYHPPIQASHGASHNSAIGWIMIIVFAVLLIGALLFAFYMMTGGLDFSVLFN